MCSYDKGVTPTLSLRLSGYLSFILIGWNAVLLPSLIRSIEHTFGVSDAVFGLLYLVGSSVYTVGALGGGFLTERLGRKVVLAGAAALIGLGLAAEGAAPVWLLMLAATLPVNIGAGAIDGGTQGLFLDVYREARGGAMNLLHVFFSVGALVSPLAVGLLVTKGVDWRTIFIASGFAGVLLAVRLATLPMPSGRHSGEAKRQAEEIEAAERSLLPFLGLAAAISFYVAAELGVSSWLVKYLNGAPLATATGVLSAFWAGMALGRFLSNWLAERVAYSTFIIASAILSSVALAGAVLVPWLAVAAVLFAATGFFYGPIYPTIMALGGNFYPHRLAALSGALASAAVAGSIVYPPLMGVLESHIGLRGGLLGAALIGLGVVAGIVGANAARSATAPSVPVRAAPPLPDRQSQAPHR